MTDDQISGITKAINLAGNQSMLAVLIYERTGTMIRQSRISDWERSGRVPKRRAELVHRATGVPIDDLVRDKSRAHRIGPKRRHPTPAGQG